MNIDELEKILKERFLSMKVSFRDEVLRTS